MVPSWNVFTVNGSPAGFLTPSAPGIDPKIENEVICDPVQGNVSDCFLIAALGSCAWNTTATLIPIKPTNNFASSFTISFWSYDRTIVPIDTTKMVLKQIPVSNKLLLRDDGMPIYAQPTSQNEIWVAIYEKAFALFAGCTQDINGNPDISQLPTTLKPSDALSILVNLNLNPKRKFSFDPKYPPQTACSMNPPSLTFNGQTYADYFEIIKTACTLNAINSSSGKTKYPMVAWTYDSEAYSPWKSQGLKYRYPTTNKERMLMAKHTYSILGTYSSGNSKYIVLRDPYGTLGSTPLTDSFIPTYLPPSSSLWDPVQDHSKFLPRDLSTYPCGLFGLRVDAFTNCFSGFGWIQ
jgi:hypothetical protein